MKNKDWTGNKNSIFKTLGISNHTNNYLYLTYRQNGKTKKKERIR